MNKTELESKHLAELHSLAAAAGIDGYRMLSRQQLIEKLSSGGGGGSPQQERNREPRQRRERRPRQPRERRPRGEPAAKAEPGPPAAERPPTGPPAPPPAAQAGERPKRRRRRRFRRRGPKSVRVHDLLLPSEGGRQALVYGETRASCTALLREIAAELSQESKGPDPIGLLIDPTPEELADWKRDAPQAEIVSAGQARHAGDALAQAASRAGGGEDVIVLIDSLSRFVEAFGSADEAKQLFDAGRGSTGAGTLTVVAAVERPA
jgi:hypothetical protein